MKSLYSKEIREILAQYNVSYARRYQEPRKNEIRIKLFLVEGKLDNILLCRDLIRKKIGTNDVNVQIIRTRYGDQRFNLIIRIEKDVIDAIRKEEIMKIKLDTIFEYIKQGKERIQQLEEARNKPETVEYILNSSLEMAKIGLHRNMAEYNHIAGMIIFDEVSGCSCSFCLGLNKK